jgi:hypothetical protein
MQVIRVALSAVNLLGLRRPVLGEDDVRHFLERAARSGPSRAARIYLATLDDAAWKADRSLGRGLPEYACMALPDARLEGVV